MALKEKGVVILVDQLVEGLRDEFLYSIEIELYEGFFLVLVKGEREKLGMEFL